MQGKEATVGADACRCAPRRARLGQLALLFPTHDRDKSQRPCFAQDSLVHPSIFQPQLRVNSREELELAKRFRHVVVGAAVEALDDVLLPALGADHDDWDRDVGEHFPDLDASFESVELGHHLFHVRGGEERGGEAEGRRGRKERRARDRMECRIRIKEKRREEKRREEKRREEKRRQTKTCTRKRGLW